MTTPVITAPRTFTVTTKRGDRKTVQSTLTHEEAADICAKLDSDFARDLALAFREWKTGRRRFFSGPQTAWLQILVNEELGRRREHARKLAESLGRKLATKKQEVVELRARGLSYRQIASRLGISESTAARACGATY